MRTRAEFLATKVSHLTGLALALTCPAGCPNVLTHYPLRMMADRYGALTLGELVPRLRCHACKRKPVHVAVIGDQAGDGVGGPPRTWRVVLLP